jgi:CRP-like cAMP-binding protein
MTGHAVSLSDIETLSRALDLHEPVGAYEREILKKLPVRSARIAAGKDVIRQGDRPTDSCLLVEGLLCRYKTLAQGQRQILSFHFPGEIPDLQSFHLRQMDHSLCALTDCRLAYVPHSAISQLFHEAPSMAAMLWKFTLVDASIFREWLAGVGRRSAPERMAHLLCEIFVRMKLLGLVPGKRLHFPVTQSDLADALGLSLVHVNRTLQELRRDGLISWIARDFVVEDWQRLKAFANFDPSYLHLREPLPADLA